MRSRLALVACLCAAHLGAACRADPGPLASPSAGPLATTAPGPMPPGVVARVGEIEIDADTVGRIAAAQGVPPARALELAIRDALLVSAARERGLDTRPAVQAEISALLARSLLRSLYEEAERQGPVTDAELRDITQRRWLDLDRPEASRTVHAVVHVPEGADAATRDKARAVAEAIRAAVAPAHELALGTEPPAPRPGRRAADPAETRFMDLAKEIPKQGLEVTIQPLPPVAADGRVLVAEPQTFDPTFARAAAELGARGDISQLITSPFGVHVIMLLERIPPVSIPAEERRRMVHEEIVAERARAAHLRLLQALRPKPAGSQDGVDALLELVRIEQ